MKNQRDLPVLNRSSRSFFASFCAASSWWRSPAIRGDSVLEVDVKSVTSRHEVGVVDVLDERLALERFSCFFLSIFFVTCAFCKEKQWSVIKTLGRARVRVARALGLQDLKRWIIVARARARDDPWTAPARDMHLK